MTDTATLTSPTAQEAATVQQWIADFCAGRTTVTVGHRMHSVQEGIQNIPLERVLYLVRHNTNVKAYVAGSPERMRDVTAFVADCIAQYVRDTYATANYPGD